MRSSAIPATTAARQPLLEEGGDLRDDVVVARVGLHRPRLALHVHQAEVRVRPGHDLGQRRVAAQRGDVVDELRAELERPAAATSAFEVSIETGAPASCSSTGTTRRSSSSTETRLGAGPRRLAADVDDRRALVQHPPRARDRVVRVEVDAGVRERVRRDVDDAHHGRPRETLLDGLSSSVGRLGPWAISKDAAPRRGDSCARSSARSGMASPAPCSPACSGRRAPSPRRSSSSTRSTTGSSRATTTRCSSGCSCCSQSGCSRSAPAPFATCTRSATARTRTRASATRSSPTRCGSTRPTTTASARASC